MSVLYKALQKAAKEHEQRAAQEGPEAEAHMPEAPAPTAPQSHEAASPPPPTAPAYEATVEDHDDPADRWSSAPVEAPSEKKTSPLAMLTGNRAALMGGVALGVLLIAGGVAWFLLNEDDAPMQVATPLPTAPVPAVSETGVVASDMASADMPPMIAERQAEETDMAAADTQAAETPFEPADLSPAGDMNTATHSEDTTDAAAVNKPVTVTPTAQKPAATATPTRAPQPAPVAAQRQAPVQLDRDDEANLLSPPITVVRADAELSGVGNAVQVREVSQQAKDDVGMAYDALISGNFSTALGFYDRALTAEPNSMLALLGRAAALQKMGRSSEAQTAYMNVLSRDKKNVEALTNLTGLIAERSPGEALDRLRELEREYPYFSPIKAQIGLILASSEDPSLAVGPLREAVAMAPENTMYKYNLAVVLDRLGLRDQAISAYASVLDALRGGRGPETLDRGALEQRVAFLRSR